ncbi:MAG: MltA domain-containing protein [Magnetococcales bacterium]|nr:MltA domain-containing protein [Magnetococcales bacterium]
MIKFITNIQKTRLLPLSGFFVLLLLAGCSAVPTTPLATATQAEQNVLQPMPWSEAKQVITADTSLKEWAVALNASAEYFAKKKPATKINFGKHTVSALQMTRSLRELASVAQSEDSLALQTYLEKNFLLFRSVGNDQKGNVLVTAYYEPLLYGSLTRSDRYKYPLYNKPKDLLKISLTPWLPKKKKKIIARFADKTLTPYYDRAEIDLEKRLANRSLELVWVDNLVDLFFLQIQGSGRVELAEGGVLRVGYHEANGHPYHSIGRILIQEDAISREKMSLPAIRQWLRQNPSQRDRLLNANPSYVFFRKLSGGPYGNIAVALTPGRSIATDYRIFPRGAAGMLITTLPHFSKNDQKNTVDWQQSARFIVNQDTGGAIRGPGRVDLFLGFGEEAEQTAGIMKQGGSKLYFIAPKLQNQDK